MTLIMLGKLTLESLNMTQKHIFESSISQGGQRKCAKAEWTVEPGLVLADTNPFLHQSIKNSESKELILHPSE